MAFWDNIAYGITVTGEVRDAISRAPKSIEEISNEIEIAGEKVCPSYIREALRSLGAERTGDRYSLREKVLTL